MLGVAFLIFLIIAFLPQEGIDGAVEGFLDPDTWFDD